MFNQSYIWHWRKKLHSRYAPCIGFFLFFQTLWIPFKVLVPYLLCSSLLHTLKMSIQWGFYWIFPGISLFSLTNFHSLLPFTRYQKIVLAASTWNMCFSILVSLPNSYHKFEQLRFTILWKRFEYPDDSVYSNYSNLTYVFWTASVAACLRSLPARVAGKKRSSPYNQGTK